MLVDYSEYTSIVHPLRPILNIFEIIFIYLIKTNMLQKT